MNEASADVNVLIRLLTGDDPANQQAGLQLFKQVEPGNLTLVPPDTTIADAVFVLTSPRHYRLDRAQAAAALTPSVRLPGFKVQNRRAALAADLTAQHPTVVRLRAALEARAGPMRGLAGALPGRAALEHAVAEVGAGAVAAPVIVALVALVALVVAVAYPDRPCRPRPFPAAAKPAPRRPVRHRGAAGPRAATTLRSSLSLLRRSMLLWHPPPFPGRDIAPRSPPCVHDLCLLLSCIAATVPCSASGAAEGAQMGHVIARRGPPAWHGACHPDPVATRGRVGHGA
jgi:predicted nucleic acid-binding protein